MNTPKYISIDICQGSKSISDSLKKPLPDKSSMEAIKYSVEYAQGHQKARTLALRSLAFKAKLLRPAESGENSIHAHGALLAKRPKMV